MSWWNANWSVIFTAEKELNPLVRVLSEHAVESDLESMLNGQKFMLQLGAVGLNKSYRCQVCRAQRGIKGPSFFPPAPAIAFPSLASSAHQFKFLL
ncbi:hypothetical protein PCANC_00920 [Puccinia coronata f. sp. avenae]|uniref:Uncharacterized protein n=1 Tax=Puccinia coronata f. sp. avenae TaxID=200324 RepID=A0A2N5W6F2_9BASI|nr:hypothetical protein PCANC_00920 [Puccinia coronata f. sp. avenae]